MKKILALMMIASVLFTGCGSTASPRAKKHNSMSIDESRTVTPMKNGVKHGVEKHYFGDGKLKLSVPYVDGKKNGTEYRYLKTMVEHKYFLARTQEWKNGVEDGALTTYHSNGKVDYRVNYKNGLKQGKCIGYNSEGKINERGQYLNDKEYGTWNYYNDYGEKVSTKKYAKGSKESRESHEFHRRQMEIVEEQIDQDCKKFFTPMSILFDSSGKPIQSKPARKLWYMNHCGKYMKK